ncbi:MAG: TRAP transporter small permease subunit, partial [Candidatus Latescibacteria bacterium]|nr:TRAP transporter small permease subunit [Candidatus Latescibacterota bacterium]
MSQIINIIDRISRITGKTVSYIILIVVGIVCYEVFLRYLFHRPTVWASEAIVICCAFLYVLGAAWTLQENRHVKIDILWDKLSPRNK